MSKKIKIILFSSIGVALVLFVIAFLMTTNKTYEVTFDTNGGSNISSQEVKKGEKVNKPIDPTKDGYVFLHWNYNNQEYDFSLKVVEDMTLIAIWEEVVNSYSISLEIEGNSRTFNVNEGEKINLEELSSWNKVGYEIKWFNGEEEVNLETFTINGNLNLSGKYVKVKTYTVKFNSDGGTKVDNQVVNENRLVKEPIEPTKEGYLFDGWYLNNQKYDFNSLVNSNFTLTAKWIEDSNVKRYEVKFNTDGGSSVTSQKIIEGKKATTPKDPTKEGYKFEGWYLNNKKYDFNKVITSDITLTAKWKKLEKYTVTFNTDGGNNISNQEVIEGGKVTKPSNPTKPGYTFKEWQLNGKTYDFNSVVTGNIALKAVYEKDKEKYTVTFNTDGGSNVSSQTITEGGKVTKPNNPTKPDYTFKEWQLNGKTYDFNSVVDGNITLKAVWKEIAKYTVTFNADGGNNISSQTIQEGGKVTKPSNPTKTGYTFKEWQLNGKTYDFNSTVTGNITLKAVWNQKEYTVKKTKVDDLSLDVRLSVYEDGGLISFKNIKYNDTIICTSVNPAVNASDISKITSFTVTLLDGTIVTATVD